MDSKILLNPYADTRGNWFKGNLHTHSSVSPCGQVKLERVCKLYFESGYDFIALTDHDVITDKERLDTELLIIPGYEASKDSHVLCLNAKKIIDGRHQEIVDGITAQGGAAILCHPNWIKDDYWPLGAMQSLTGYTGIEILNGVIRRLKGSGEALAEWDYLLSRGKRIWGFANDDFHLEDDICRGWNMVRAQGKTVEGIIQALRAGNFYASTGVSITKIEVENNVLKITADAERNYFIGAGGKVLREVSGPGGKYEIRGDEVYVRVEAVRDDGARAWSQPVFVTS